MTSSSAAGRPLFLLSNDDGVHSEGLHAARAALATIGDVVVCAPESEQSAVSHSLSLHSPRRLRETAPGIFAVDGTPADCVYVALHGEGRVLPRRPDVIVSGINRGLNLGQDAFYSGTIAAAREGALRGIPGLAVSAEVGADLGSVAQLTARIATQLVARTTGSAPAGRAERRLLSLNVPKSWSGEVRAARLGARIYEETVDFRKDPRGREYLWIGGPGVRHASDPGSDTDAFDEGAASLTSLLLDLTREADPLLAEIARKVVAS